jgi:hypothetical protein
MATGNLQKAFLLNEYSNEKIPCQYNPEKVALTLSTLVDCPATASKNVPDVHHKGFTPLVYTFNNVVFDTYEGPQESMKSVHEEYTSKLLDLLRISKETLKIDQAAKAGSPPQCSFHWGDTWSVAGFMTTCTVNWTLFNSKGTPVRATASFSITRDRRTRPLEVRVDRQVTWCNQATPWSILPMRSGVTPPSGAAWRRRTV